MIDAEKKRVNSALILQQIDCGSEHGTTYLVFIATSPYEEVTDLFCPHSGVSSSESQPLCLVPCALNATTDVEKHDVLLSIGQLDASSRRSWNVCPTRRN